jgi:hypothetical protein
MEITGSLKPSDALALPLSSPLDQWPDDLIVALPRGISRHVVRFVDIANVVFAVKEISEPLARHEYALLKRLRALGLPCVKPVAVITDRSTDGSLDGLLITKHLTHSLPYRGVFATAPSEATVTRLIDALAVLLVRLHLAKFAWQDCSLSNALFRRDAGDFSAYLVDAETGELRNSLSDGMRWYDVDTAVTNMAGELMDLQAAGRIGEHVDVVDLALRLRSRYEQLWALITEPVTMTAGQRHELDGHIRRLNNSGFDVAEIRISDMDGDSTVTLQAKVVEAGHHRRRLFELTGLDVQENQARRLLNDIDAYRASHPDQFPGGKSTQTKVAATRWLTEVFQPTVEAVPDELSAKLEPAELFHQILEHRWYLSEKEGRDVGITQAIAHYFNDVLPAQPDERTWLPARTVREALADEVN